MNKLIQRMVVNSTGNLVVRPGEVSATIDMGKLPSNVAYPCTDQYEISLNLMSTFYAKSGPEKEACTRQAEKAIVRELYRDLLTYTSRIRSAVMNGDTINAMALIDQLEDEYLG